MASSYCWNCFSRLRPPPRPIVPAHSSVRDTPRAPFHSTAPQHAAPPKKTRGAPAGVLKFREASAARVRPKKIPERPHRMTPDEISAARKPLALSNPNALEVSDVEALSGENMADESSRGKLRFLPREYLERLRALRAFKSTQGWPMFKAPGTFMREESLELGRLIRGIGGEGDMKGKSVARIVTGGKGTGKSIHLTQAMTMGLLNNWVVVNVPDAREYTSGTTAYAPLERDDKVQYVQKNATASLLESISQANNDVLSNLHISQKHERFLTDRVGSDASLLSLARFGASRPEYSWVVFQGLWSELTATSPAPNSTGTKPFQPRPPVLITVDNLSHWMVNTAYFDAHYEPIPAHKMALVKHFLSIMSYPSRLPNGGVALYATSTNNSPLAPAFHISLKQLAARKAGINPKSADFPLPGPYEQLDTGVMGFFSKVYAEVQELGGISRDETKKLLEYYALNGLMRERISEDLVGEKWTLSGGGVIGELERFGKRIRALSLS